MGLTYRRGCPVLGTGAGVSQDLRQTGADHVLPGGRHHRYPRGAPCANLFSDMMSFPGPSTLSVAGSPWDPYARSWAFFDRRYHRRGGRQNLRTLIKLLSWPLGKVFSLQSLLTEGAVRMERWRQWTGNMSTPVHSIHSSISIAETNNLLLKAIAVCS